MKVESKYYQEDSMFHGFIPRIMGTRFDFLAISENKDLLESVWKIIINILSHWDLILNRFDSKSEVSYINHSAGNESIIISPDMEEILKECNKYYKSTLHFFDITLNDFSKLRFIKERTIHIPQDINIDFGGIGKGYVVNIIRNILSQVMIENAFIDFGGSTITAMGHHPYGDSWKVSLENPYTKQVIDEIELRDTTLSTSGNTEQYNKHIINPILQQYNSEKKMTTVISPNPVDAEVLSTVLMVAEKDIRGGICQNFKNISTKIYEL